MPRPDLAEPAESWPHYLLYRSVRDALYAVPAHFSSRTVIEGIVATDVQTLNSVLGATIEEQVVATLNRMRPVWDPDEQYQRFFFQRQAQVFPDVLFKSDRNGQEIVLGIELKGWYLLAFGHPGQICGPIPKLLVVRDSGRAERREHRIPNRRKSLPVKERPGCRPAGQRPGQQLWPAGENWYYGRVY